MLKIFLIIVLSVLVTSCTEQNQWNIRTQTPPVAESTKKTQIVSDTAKNFTLEIPESYTYNK